MEIKVKGVAITERGWAGHYCLAHKCTFHRNTLLVKGNLRIVVSSVGSKIKNGPNGMEIQTIGCDRYYETTVWFADASKWQDADVARGEIECYSPSSFADPWDEMPANELHDKIVEEYVNKMANNEIDENYEEEED